MSGNPFVMSRGDSATSAALTSRYCKDPRELPCFVVPESQLYIKLALTSSSTCSDVNASSYFSAMANRGAQASVSVADTYVTCANLVGRGRLYNVITPSHSASAQTPSIRLTIDGVVYVIKPSTTVNAGSRLVLGVMTPYLPTTANDGVYHQADFILPNSYGDGGFYGAMTGGFWTVGNNASIVTPEQIETYNLPFLQFESGCLIEYKTSLLTSTTGDKIGGASYRMLPT